MDTAFFWLSKLAWLVIAPESVLVLLVLAAWVLLARGSAKWGRRVLGVVAAGMLVLTFLPVGEWVLYPLETRFPANPVLPQKVAGIIVLGGAEEPERSFAWGQVEVNDAAERFFASIALSRRYPDAQFVFTSGSANLLDPRLKGASVARELYEGQGLDASRMMFESESRNTFENATLSKALARPVPGQNWVLVTSASHMPRSVGIFCRVGWHVVAYPVDHRTMRGESMRLKVGGLVANLADLSIGIKEWVGLAAYYFTGKTTALFPDGCHNQ